MAKRGSTEVAATVEAVKGVTARAVEVRAAEVRVVVERVAATEGAKAGGRVHSRR